MSISQNFPAEGPTLNLNFAGSKKLDPRITFTRTSIATYMDDNGLITIAPTDTPRFEHSVVGVGTTITGVESLGLLIEESRTNLIIQSEAFNTGWSLAGATVGVNSTTAPDGTSNADAALEDGTNGQHTIYRDVTTSPSSTYTSSCFIKAGTRTYGEIFINGGGAAGSGTVGGRFDLTNLTVTSTGNLTLQSSSITSYSNGWYRCSITGSVGGSGSVVRYHVRPVTSSTGEYQGVSGDAGIYIWGAQLEVGAFPTSYIPTVASTVTRSADSASITGTNFSEFYNPSEGTLGFIGDTVSPSSYSAVYQIDGGDANNRLYLDKNSSTGRVVSTVSGSNQCLITLSTISSNTLFKLYGAYKLNDCAGSFNGGTVGTDTSATMPTCNMLRIGTDGNNYINGNISQLLYYPVRLPNAQLQQITQ